MSLLLLLRNKSTSAPPAPFDPSTLPGFVAYWDVRQAPTVTSSGGFIDSLAVVSGASRTLTATSTVRPAYVSTPPAYADFDGSNDVLAHTTRIFTAPAAMTIAFRAKIINPQPGSFSGRVFSEAGSGNGFGFGVGTGNNVRFSWAGTTSLSVASVDSAYNNTDYICGLVTYDGSINATGVRLYINGTEVSYQTQTDGASLANSSGVTRIGQLNATGTNPVMDFQACVVCTGVLSGADIASLSTFLGSA
jgi:Concanavalin A-like lectin/glucanases superfamily